jgi:O-antigen/teichoic acid export membrane protein
VTAALQRVSAQAGVQGMGRVAALAINLATFALLLHQLDPTAYGQMTLALTISYVAGTLSSLGVDTVVFRRVSVGAMDADDLGAALVVRALAGLAVTAAGTVVILLLDVGDGLRVALLIALVTLLLDPMLTLQQVLRAKVMLVPFAVADITSSGLLLALLLMLARDGLTAWEAVLATVVANWIVWAALSLLALRQMRPRFAHGGLGRRARGIVVEGRSLAVGDALVVAYYRADIFALGIMATGAAVGTYGAAYKFVDIAMYAQVIVIGAFFPSITRAWREDGPAALLHDLATVLIGLGALAFVIVVSVGPEIVTRFGGEAYGDTLALQAILMTAVIVMFANRLLVQALVAGGQGRRQVMCWAGGLVGGVLAFPFAAAWGPEGAATAVLVGEVGVLLLAWWHIGRAGAHPRPLPGRITAVFLAAAALSLVTAALPGPGRVIGGLALAAVAAAALAHTAIGRRRLMGAVR